MRSVVVTLMFLAFSSASASPYTWESEGTKCLPNFKGENTFIGYVCTAVGEKDQKMGLRKGDHVIGIQGTSILNSDLEEVMNLWKAFDKDAEGTLELIRGDNHIKLTKHLNISA